MSQVASWALLCGAAALGGGLNAVAGGGSFFTFPSLLWVGVPSISANATSTLALWPGSLASAFAYRQEVRRTGPLLWGLGLVSLLGGGLGGLLLLLTPSSTFDRAVPYLVLAATCVFTFGPWVNRRLRARGGALPTWASLGLQGLISVYGGYFGGGMGMLMLAVFTVIGMTDLHRMNGLKSTLGVAINAVALGVFVAGHLIAWTYGLGMALGAIAGGYGGAALARRLPASKVRVFVTACGWALTVWFFTRR